MFPVLQRVVGRVSSTVLVSVAEVRLKSCCNFLVGRRTFFFKKTAAIFRANCVIWVVVVRTTFCAILPLVLCDVCCVAAFSS